jgi:prepilin-type N-terminal cleavage/methylation domain-containing protein
MESKGFSLIEILIALIILSITLLALAGLMVQSTRNSSFGGHITEAATFAQDKLEELRATSWVGLTPGSDRKTGSNGIDYARSWTVVTNNNVKTITININWNDKTPHSMRFFSVITE